jgi:hypothetical protein
MKIQRGEVDTVLGTPCNARVTDGSEKGRIWPERSGVRHRESPYSIDLFSS